MDIAKRTRGVQRTLFTKSMNSFLQKCRSDSEATAQERQVALQLFESRMGELEASNTKYIDLLLASDASEETIQAEIESHDEYREKYLTTKAKSPTAEIRESSNNHQRPAIAHVEKPYKRPTIDIPKFDGCVSNWLKFWSHFKKIDEDLHLSEEDKMEYLKQAMVRGSKADTIIEGYPTTAENYKKALTALKTRCGRKKLLGQYYIRELLNIVLQKANQKEKQSSIAEIYDKVSSHIRALESLGVPIESHALLLYPLVESSLPEEVLRTWKRSAEAKEVADKEDEDKESHSCLEKLLEFMRSEVENEESYDLAARGFKGLAVNEYEGQQQEKNGKPKDSRRKQQQQQSSPEVPTASVLLAAEDRRKVVGIFCDGNHENAACEKAKKMPIDARKNIVKERGCCFRCLKFRHRSSACKVKITCSRCGYRHSVLMCENNGGAANKTSVSDRNESSGGTGGKVKEQNLASFCSMPDVYLQTLRVVLYSDTKEKVVRAVIDSGSQRSYIRSDVASNLGYEVRENREIVHALFGGVNSKSEKHNVYLARMKSLTGDYACSFEVMDQRTICGEVPRVTESSLIVELEKKNISLCDYDPNRKYSDTIDLLIGADVAGKLLTGNSFHLQNGLTCTETWLGWTIMGKNVETDRKDSASKHVSMFVTSAKVADLWSLDVLGIQDPIEKSKKLEKEQIVKENFLETVKFEDGRYSVDLPWVDDHAPVSRNFELAKKRLESTIKKLKKDGLYVDYDNVFREWVEEGFIEIVPEDESDNSVSHYLPHRPVIKNESTTKIRPVFDASACEKGYPSLNNCLEKGPNLIELIPTSILRFRENDIAVLADIKKAFLQINISRKDRDFLRFLWVSPDGKIIILRHKRVVFGLTCSPFLLGAIIELHLENTLRNIAEGKRKWLKTVAIQLLKSFYVDNCVTSVKTLPDLETFIEQAKEILTEGGFDLRGWEFTKDGTKKETTMVLGMVYNKNKDTISINPATVQTKELGIVTKRVILATTHKVFDPIGFTAPVSILPKLLLKRLWREKLDWDAPVDENTRKEFLTWREQLKYLTDIHITRKFGYGNYSLHTFSDASKQAYAAVTFLRVENERGVELKFLAAKARVAPENSTIPRLELLAAAIGSRQTRSIIEALGYTDIPVFYWSDSTTVLAWLSRDMQWGTFVWNRVREIRDITKNGHWKYVPTDMNPADLPSRGCDAKQLFESRWWEGPRWLCETSDKWPNLLEQADEREVQREIKKSAQLSMMSTEHSNLDDIIEKFSSYNKFIRFCAILIKFKNFRLKKDRNTVNRLTYLEIKTAEIKVLKYLQREMFVSAQDPKLASFQTLIDNDGLLRMKTKILERDDKFPFLCPIILKNHRLIEMLIRETHENMCHAGVQTVMAHLREKFWILSMRKTVRSIIHKCIICQKQAVKSMQANPPPLPAHRVKDAAVFQVTGVDFAGPLILKGRQKAWICLYTCGVYRAVHLELVTSLSTQEFLGSLRRFIGRRGRPDVIYSDNGLNFVGANNAMEKLNWHHIGKYSSAKRIDWRFNPPTAAWWGGWWERLIGMLKKLLRAVLGKACLTYEEMLTVLCDCESVLNSRPLTYLSEETSDVKPLTPAMFLCDLRESETPDLDLLDKVNLNSRFKRRQEIMLHLRIRFRKEYLSQLILRRSSKETREIKVGDVVLIGEDNSKRIDWPLARVEKLIIGRDGIARVAILKAKEGTYKRPIQRLYPLELSANESLCDVIKEKVNKPQTETKELDCKPIEIAKDLKSNEPDPHIIKTRSGRLVKKPNFYKA